MIPEYLTTNPFPDSKWSPDMLPVIELDGIAHALNNIDEPVTGNVAYFVGVNQKSFEKAMTMVKAKVMHFYDMRVSDLTSLQKNIELCELAIHWNSKLEDISPIAKIKGLKSLVLEDTPKVSDLSPLSQCTELESFEYSGGMWKKNKTESLEPISKLKKLSNLRLLNLAVEGGLKPLASLPSLRELELSNQFPTEEYAYLSVMLDSVRCDYFAPYIELPNPIEEKNVMVIGKRKPFLNKQTDAKKLAKYVEQFDGFKRKYAANKALQPTQNPRS
jgi:hypothetical protein